MRIHHLAVAAFGPFADRVDLDFTELNEAGLFLLSGATGAGKSSLLDALCFALYGTVPGERGVKGLKSQHAADDARPEVVLDFSIRDRRFVLRRSPEWSRPKRRGEGLTHEKAAATLIETTSGSDHLLSSRAQEIGLLVGELIGMNAGQFQQVAMLPQGQFQTFLRASSQERHAVLQHLFATDRFSRIEEWVADHSRELGRRAEADRRAVQRILDSVAERAETSLPESLHHDTWGPEAAAAIPGWVAAVVDEAAARATAARAEDADAQTRASEARETQQLLAQQRALNLRRLEAQARLATLDEATAQIEDARRRLADDERASRCAGVLRVLAVAEDEADQAARAARASAELAPADTPEQLRARLADLRALRPRVDTLRDARTHLQDAHARLASLRDQLAVHEHTTAALPDEEERLTTLVREARQLASGLGSATGERDLLVSRLAAARTRDRIRPQVEELRHRCQDARDTAQDARERLQELIAHRLDGIAAELAGHLADDQPCPVCGSASHPSPALPGVDAVGEQEQRDAAKVADRARDDYDRLRSSLEEHERALDRALAVSGTAGADDLDAARAEAEARVAAATLAGAELVGHEQALAELTGRLRRSAEVLRGLTAELARQESTVFAREGAVADLESELTSTGFAETDDLEAAVEQLTRDLDAAEQARADELAHQIAVRRRDACAGDAAAEIEAAGLGDVGQARAALLRDDARVTLRATVTDHEQAVAQSRAVLADPEVVDAPEVTADDLAAADRALSVQLSVAAVTARALVRSEDLLASLHALRERLAAALEAWQPLREKHERADSMSRLVRGIGADNTLQMRLSAYVLATRLDQVLDAANERLAHMRDQRYLLRRTSRAVRKGSQAGLGLEIVDEWTGTSRDPATLSGGETFVVSLALALGLADVVTQETGGAELETLFVDEGFGMLDPDTLDDVMDRLDGLRAGGRTVGVISHVTEMRNRIPTQVHVDKGRHGSTVALRSLVG